MSEPARRPWLVLVAIAVSAALLWLISRQLDLASLGALMARADAPSLVLAVLVSLTVNLPLSALALRHALSSHGVRLPLEIALRATLGHLALHAGATLVVGKAARALYLSRAHGADAKRVLGAEVTLVWLKVATLALLAALGASLEGALWAIPLLVLSLAGVLGWRRRRGGELGALVASFVWSLAMALGQLAVFALALAALGSSVPIPRLFAVFPLCLFGAKLPVALMGLGVREVLVVVLFRGAAAPETLLGASLLFSLIEQVLPGVAGLVFAPRFVTRALGG